MQEHTVNRRRWQALLALFAIYLQVLAPIILSPSTALATTGNFSSYGVICTAYGAKVINLSTGEEVPTHRDHSEKCPLCLFSHAQFIADSSSSGFKFALPSKNGERLQTIELLDIEKIAAPSDCLSRSPPSVL